MKSKIVTIEIEGIEFNPPVYSEAQLKIHP